ncbi:MAG: c-type cytochrome [Thermoanaerobaculia bacterium]|nr:c-type cytochrome [Thermoanaerobaculia bacterium]
MRGAVNLLLLLLLAAVLGLHWVLGADPERRNVELFPAMVDAVPFESYAANPHFADGKTAQAPPPGARVREAGRFGYGPGPEEALRAGRELANPYSPHDDTALSRGAAVWATYCRVCHGPSGAGDGPVARRGVPAPPSIHTGRARAMADGQLFHIVSAGQANMPGYAAQVLPDDRWRAILHLRALQAAGPPAGSAEDAPAGSPEGTAAGAGPPAGTGAGGAP